MTDPSNASRTLCFDITERAWSTELCEAIGVPLEALGEVRPSACRYGTVSKEVAGGRFKGVPVSGIAGDQQAALFGHCCHHRGETKVTYGTGSFVLMNLGARIPPPTEGLLTTVAWDLGDSAPAGSDDSFTYALEGAVFSSGATIQWLRDGLGIIEDTAQTGPLAAEVPDNEGVFLIPAFAGLGSPWWDASARGTIVGITKGTRRAHLARAAVEAMAYQCRDVLDAMGRAAGQASTQLRADGGAAVMDLLLQFQADQCGVPVARPQSTEVTALGAAMLGRTHRGRLELARGAAKPQPGRSGFRAEPAASCSDADHAAWRAALERSRYWEPSSDELAVT